MTDIFHEVDEELRHDKWRKLWKSYGKYVIAVLLLIVASTAVTVTWREYSLRQRMISSETFLSALKLARADRVPEALSELVVLKEEGSAGYSVLAQFRAAALRTEEGEMAEAIKIYNRISEDTSEEKLLRELAVLYSVMLQSATDDVASLISLLTPIAEDNHPWRYSARETIAALYIRGGKTAKAREIFTALVDDIDVPRNMRARAAEMLRVLDG